MIIRQSQVESIVSDNPRWGRVVTQRIADAGGLTQLGASIQTLLPGAKGSVRHWHPHVDEMLVVLSGEVTVTEDDGPHTLRAGDSACWPAGVPNGHTIDNRSDAPATVLVLGARGKDDTAIYVADEDAQRRQAG